MGLTQSRMEVGSRTPKKSKNILKHTERTGIDYLFETSVNHEFERKNKSKIK
jgi:hypothetical protein